MHSVYCFRSAITRKKRKLKSFKNRRKNETRGDFTLELGSGS